MRISDKVLQHFIDVYLKCTDDRVKLDHYFHDIFVVTDDLVERFNSWGQHYFSSFLSSLIGSYVYFLKIRSICAYYVKLGYISWYTNGFIKYKHIINP